MTKQIDVSAIALQSMLSDMIGDTLPLIADDFATYSFVAADLVDARGATLIDAPFPFFARSSAPLKSSNAHQIPNAYRVEGSNPLLPSALSLATHGNPYPCEKSLVDKVPVSRPIYNHYRDVIYVAYAVYEFMVANDSDKGFTAAQLYANEDIRNNACALKGSQISFSENTNGNHIYYGLLDTLRDLENCGLAFCINGKTGNRNGKTSAFRLQQYVIELSWHFNCETEIA